MDTLTAEKIEELRAMLDAERDSLEEELSSYGRVLGESGDWQGSSSAEGIQSDPTDAADQIEELVTNVPLVEELEKRHREIMVALEKVEGDGYGTCETCGEMIPLDRLEVNPAAAMCIKHAAA